MLVKDRPSVKIFGLTFLPPGKNWTLSMDYDCYVKLIWIRSEYIETISAFHTPVRSFCNIMIVNSLWYIIFYHCHIYILRSSGSLGLARKHSQYIETFAGACHCRLCCPETCTFFLRTVHRNALNHICFYTPLRSQAKATLSARQVGQTCFFLLDFTTTNKAWKQNRSKKLTSNTSSLILNMWDASLDACSFPGVKLRQTSSLLPELCGCFFFLLPPFLFPPSLCWFVGPEWLWFQQVCCLFTSQVWQLYTKSDCWVSGELWGVTGSSFRLNSPPRSPPSPPPSEPFKPLWGFNRNVLPRPAFHSTNMVSALCISLDLEAEEEKLVSSLGGAIDFVPS